MFFCCSDSIRPYYESYYSSSAVNTPCMSEEETDEDGSDVTTKNYERSNSEVMEPTPAKSWCAIL